MRFLTTLTVFVFALPAFAGGIGSQVPPLKRTGPATHDYTAGAAQAVRDGRPLVTFVGCTPRTIAGPVTCTTPTLPGYDAPAVVISVPGEGWLVWKATLPATATDAQIRAAISPKAAQPVAAPFERAGPSSADDSLERGPWPAELDFPSGMRRFRRAKMTQYVDENRGVGQINFVHRIIPAPRTQTEAKYRISGGMVGLAGWRSDVYSNGVKPTTWRGTVEVWNGSNFQAAQAMRRSYPDGAKFFDVLSTDKGVFAIRERRKTGGKWDYIVHQEYQENAPTGYKSVSLKECQRCHQEAGTGSYASALVPGGDETFSDPIEGLE